MSVRETLRYTVIETTPDGGSRFADAELPLTTHIAGPGIPPMAAATLSSGTGVRYLRTDPVDSEPHCAPERQWVVVLRGIIETTTSDGEKRRFEAGDITLALDTEGRGHLADAVGDEPLEVLFIPYVG